MNWIQEVDPFGNIVISTIVAALPIIFIFWALLFRKMKGHKASLLGVVLSLIIAVTVYKMPLSLAVLSTADGFLYGLFPICWIVISALFLFNITVESGQFEVIKRFLASITSDRRIQLLLIAFSFGAFLEGTAGFGAPVAITAAMLVGLGYKPLLAAGLCLIANTAPVAFGSIGIPITVAAQMTGIPELAISQMVGRTLPLLSFMLPFYMVTIICGCKGAKDILPAILVSGGSFAIIQWGSSNFLGPALPDILAGIGSMLCLILLLRVWKPKHIFRFENEVSSTDQEVPTKYYNRREKLTAWAPFILLTTIIIIWGIHPVKRILDDIGLVELHVPLLDNAIISVSGKAIPHVFRFNFLSAAGTAIILASVISLPITGLSYKQGFKILVKTIVQIRFPIITISSILGFAYLLNDSGMVLTIAVALTKTGYLFPFFAPILGWIGVFVTGSDTSSNALFSKLQAVAAESINIDPVLTVAGNTAGGVVGKMVSPSSVAVAAAAGNLIGREPDLFKFTLKHSLIFLLMICLITLMQAYLFRWIIPFYN